MDLSPLTAISPIDGRYRGVVEVLGDFFSEAALIKYRTKVEIEYFIALCEIPLPHLSTMDKEKFVLLRDMYEAFPLADAERVKQIEKITNHDVKAVEYLLKEKFQSLGLDRYKEYIHFGLTSQDINNTAVPMMLRDAFEKILAPALNETLSMLKQKAEVWKSIPMLARTHGQPASPTTLGKEIAVFAERLDQQLQLLAAIPFSGKLGSATGNFNAHRAAFPEIDWVDFADRFLRERLGLVRQKVTTQIEHYDHMAAFFDNLKRINTILIDLCRDIWTYISLDYFKQKIKKDEVGSSTMPHKVNPIDFENAEGNFGVANAAFEHLSAKLPISRLQRDLTDSTVTRNIGVPMAHTLISLKSLAKGLNKLVLNESAIRVDLEKNWAVVAEGIQTILRREGYPEPYEALKALTRTNHTVDREAIRSFVEGLDVSREIKEELHRLTPQTYTGIIEF